MSAASRYIRFDDYPVCEYLTHDEYRGWLFMCLRMCRERRVRYILGVTPGVLTLEQSSLILPELERGSVVMHGFTHAYNSPTIAARARKCGNWADLYKSMMANGGEFGGITPAVMQEWYVRARAMLVREFGDRYDDAHFIAPFNRYTEALIEVLSENCCRYIHGSDEAEYTFDHHGVQRIVSHYHFGYDYAGEVVKRLSEVLKAKEQITLHWFYDCTKRPHWRDEYTRLLDALAKDPEYVATA